MITASAPTRLDFGGGWTDVPPYPEERGGFVCNLAIERRAVVRMMGPDHRHPPGSSDPLIAGALRRAARLATGRPDLPLAAHQITIGSDFPVGAGLGGSSAAGVALAAGLAAAMDLPHRADPTALAEWSRAVEVEELGIAGGRQDHYAAAYGGALGLEFGASTTVHPIPLTDSTRSALERRWLLVYTGESRISATTITAVLDAYRDRVPRVVQALDRMATLARQMADTLRADRAGDQLDPFGALVDEHWHHQRALHPGITTARIDRIDADARAAGAEAIKALGASGGGCVLVGASVDRMPAVRQAVAPLGTLLDWRVATSGVSVEA